MKKLLAILIALVMCLPIFSACGEVSMSVAEKSLEMQMYEEYELDVKLGGLDASDVVWTSSDTKVLTVQGGKITAVGMGSATVTATCGELKQSCDVLVTRNRIGRALSVNKSSLTIEVGSEEQVTATFKESGKVLDSVDVVWESSLPDVVSVDQNGTIKAIKRGNAIVSAYTCYKGQDFVKDIQVRSTVTAAADAELVLQESDTGSSLTELGAEKLEYGFAETETAYKYVSTGGADSRIFANGAYTADNVPNYDRLLFKIRFTAQPEAGTMLYLANYRKGVKGMNNLVTRDSCFLFYGEDGKIAKTFDVNTTYMVAINLNKTGEGVEENGVKTYEYGFAFLESAEAYVGGAKLCSEDYFLDTYGFEVAEELPDLTYIYAETGSGLNVGTVAMEEFDKYWTFNSSGTSEAWDNSIWNNRVAFGGVAFANYRKYEYMRMDVMFTNVNFRNIVIWTGGYSITYQASGAIGSSEGNVQENDLRIYLGEEDVTGKPLETGKVYTFRIRIQRDNLENVAFGLNVNSATANAIYFANPLLTNY